MSDTTPANDETIRPLFPEAPAQKCKVQGAEVPGAAVPSAACSVQECGGTGFARLDGVGARRYEDLVAWQLADELKRKVYELVDNSPARSDFRFRDQIKASASSAPTNIADGFGYYRHPEFARFVRIARAEINETHHHLRDGVDRHHWSKEEADPLRELADRAAGATVGLLKYLMATDAPSPWPKRRPRP